MTVIAILSAHEQKLFDSPPNFTMQDRLAYFSYDLKALNITDKLQTSTNKIGFLLQLGYFKANGKFFTSKQLEYKEKDIEYLAKKFCQKIQQNFYSKPYQNKRIHEHGLKILTLLGWQPFNQASREHLTKYIIHHTQNQLLPKQVFLLSVDFCWQHKIELPTYNTLAELITSAYNNFELTMLNRIDLLLNKGQKDHLLSLVASDSKTPMSRPIITTLKKVNHSLQPLDINDNVEALDIIKGYFYQFKDVICQLSLSDQATEYFAIWINKATTFQLSNFADKNKLYLHLLAYIKHQYYLRQDLLVDIFLKSVQSDVNKATNQLDNQDKVTKKERKKAMVKLSGSHKDLRTLINVITETVKSTILSELEKLAKITELVDNYHQSHDTIKMEDIVKIEDIFDKIGKDHDFFNILESLSIKLQRRVSQLIKLLDFNLDTSDAKLIEAILHFQSIKSEISKDSPTEFLEKKEKEVLSHEKEFRVSLYKILLFVHMAKAIKAGNLNLQYSYRYKAIQEYLIDQETWLAEKKNLLQSAGLSQFSDCNTVLSILKQKLDENYHRTNQNFITGKNEHLKIEDNKLKITTPKTKSDEIEYIPSLLSQVSYIPILQILSDTNQITNFTESFKHFSVKHKKMKPNQESIFAGILGNGCNIGINRIPHISTGVSEDVIVNTVNWCFSLKNIQNANNKILSTLNKIALPDSFRANKGKLHTSSNGRKVTVAVDSLNANYSYKYFGRNKGASMYTFIDERHLLFHSTVISASEREAAYVIDGLLQNEVIKSDIHSTDTHGYTEAIFAATHFLGVTFAPRIKSITKQHIYSFITPKTYEKQNYQILPSRQITEKSISEYWDDLLRFMVTIKLKHTSASLLFQRLSSYAIDHPLYKALKEFGRIIKSMFILTYFDDLELRHQIEKQLNKIESSNKFAKAVFFANSQEFRQVTKEEQEIATACMMLIQNTIVLWNYLYLSQLLVNNENPEEKQQMLKSIQRGSIVSWQHVNLQGEYDFTRKFSGNATFDMEKILLLKMK